MQSRGRPSRPPLSPSREWRRGRGRGNRGWGVGLRGKRERGKRGAGMDQDAVRGGHPHQGGHVHHTEAPPSAVRAHHPDPSATLAPFSPAAALGRSPCQSWAVLLQKGVCSDKPLVSSPLKPYKKVYVLTKLLMYVLTNPWCTPHPPTHTTHSNRYTQTLASTGLHAYDETTWRVVPAPGPDEILWGNLGMAYFTRTIRSTGMWAVFVLILIFYLPVTAAIQALVNIQNLLTIGGPALAAVFNGLPFVKQVVEGILPGEGWWSAAAGGEVGGQQSRG